MKKIVLFLTMLVGTLTAQASDYTYLTFETTDGAKVSVSVSNLTLSISGTTLTAGTQSFTLSEVMKANLDEATEIYNLQGHKVSKDQMRRGVYVIKTKQGTFKLNVK